MKQDKIVQLVFQYIFQKQNNVMMNAILVIIFIYKQMNVIKIVLMEIIN